MNQQLALRGIFALLIFLHHVGMFAAGGDSGVSFFLVLGGYVMSAAYAGRFSARSISWKAFMWRRFSRIYPYHLMGIVAAVCTMYPFFGATRWVWLANITLTQSWHSTWEYYFSIDSPSWYLSVVIFCYAVFPLITRVLTRPFFCRHPWRLLLLLAAAMALYFCNIASIAPDMWDARIYVNPLYRLMDFWLGMLLWTFLNADGGRRLAEWYRGQSRAWRSGAECGAVALYLAAMAVYPHISPRYGLASLWWVPMIALVAVTAMSEKNDSLLSRLLERKWPLRLGTLSFGIYMLQVPIIEGFARRLGVVGYEGQLPLRAIATALFLTLILSTLSKKIADLIKE